MRELIDYLNQSGLTELVRIYMIVGGILFIIVFIVAVWMIIKISCRVFNNRKLLCWIFNVRVKNREGTLTLNNTNMSEIKFRYKFDSNAYVVDEAYFLKIERMAKMNGEKIEKLAEKKFRNYLNNGMNPIKLEFRINGVEELVGRHVIF